MKDELMREVDSLPPVSFESAGEYRSRMPLLVDDVNRIIESRDDLGHLIGDNPVAMMYDNHNNHAAFMANVFSLNNYDLLLSVVPWVYRAYRNHGFSYDYFPVHLRAWEQVLREQMSPETAEPLLRVYAWLISRHKQFIALSEDTEFLAVNIDQQWRPVVESFLEAILKGDSGASLDISKEYVAGPEDIRIFYLKVIQPAMYRLGEMWENNEIPVAREHLASAVVNRILASQYLEFMSKEEPVRGRVVVAATANELHEMGAQMVANSLELEGWDVQYLGANTPNDELVDLAMERQPFILALSVAMPFNIHAAQGVIGKIREWPREKQPMIMLGGMAFHSLPRLALSLGADGYAEDCNRAVALADQWWKEKAS